MCICYTHLFICVHFQKKSFEIDHFLSYFSHDDEFEIRKTEKPGFTRLERKCIISSNQVNNVKGVRLKQSNTNVSHQLS